MILQHYQQSEWLCYYSDVASIQLIYCSNDIECSQNTCYALTVAPHLNSTQHTASPCAQVEEHRDTTCSGEYDEPRVLLWTNNADNHYYIWDQTLWYCITHNLILCMSSYHCLWTWNGFQYYMHHLSIKIQTVYAPLFTSLVANKIMVCYLP